MSNLNGKVAIVTGASKGIGAAIARAFAGAGAAVVVNYATSREGADRVVADIVEAGGRAVAVQGDVGKAADVRRLFAEARRAFDRVDVVVNNAGVFAFQAIEAVTEAEFHRQFDTNVLGIVLTTQEAVQHFGAEGGSVINIGSIISRSPAPNSAVYTATKSAVDGLTRALAIDLGPRKIRVNSINPGGTDTEGARDLGVIGSEFQRQMIASTPLGRFGQPEDIAPIAVFLASPEAGWLTGQIVLAGGGLH